MESASSLNVSGRQSSCALRKSFTGHEPLDRGKFVMADLITWNPQNDTQLERRTQVKHKRRRVNDDDEDDGKSVVSKCDTDRTDVKRPIDAYSQMKVVHAPQVRLDASGNMVIDEESLTIRHNAEAETKHYVSVTEEQGFYGNEHISSHSYRRNRRNVKSGGIKTWSVEETDKFYKILAATGTDFTLMKEYFERRTRDELKNKYKRECKSNSDRIAQAHSNPQKFDESVYDHVIEHEIASSQRRIEQQHAQRERARSRRDERLKVLDPARHDQRITKRREHALRSFAHVCAVKKHLTPVGKILMDGGVPAAGQTPHELGSQLAGVASSSSTTASSRSPSPPPPRVPLDEWEERSSKFSPTS